MKLEITHRGQVVWVQPIGSSTVCLGRSSSADIQLSAPDISGHHALVYLEDGQPHVRDLGSTNGTWIDDVPITEPLAVRVGMVVRLGEHIGLRFVDSDAPTGRWHVCPVDGLVGWPIEQSPWTLPGTHAVLRVLDDSVWLRSGEDWRELVPGRPFEVDGASFVVRASVPSVDTARPADQPVPYLLRVALSRGTATLTAADVAVTYRGANQVSLLHVLGVAQRAWVDDATLLRGVWGRTHRQHTANNLHVLIRRVRKPAEDAGLRADFLERRVGETRLNLADVWVDDD